MGVLRMKNASKLFVLLHLWHNNHISTYSNNFRYFRNCIHMGLIWSRNSCGGAASLFHTFANCILILIEWREQCDDRSSTMWRLWPVAYISDMSRMPVTSRRSIAQFSHLAFTGQFQKLVDALLRNSFTENMAFYSLIMWYHFGKACNLKCQFQKHELILSMTGKYVSNVRARFLALNTRIKRYSHLLPR